MKWKHYLSELIIVIVGIVISLAINDRIESYKESKIEKKHLQRFLDDINIDIKSLDTSIAYGVRYLENTEKILKNTNSDSLVIWITHLSEINYFKPKNVTYLTVIQSGDIKVMNKYHILERIVNLYKDYDILENQEKNHEEHIKTHIINYIYSNIDISSGRFIKPKNIVDIKNIVGSQNIMMKSILQNYTDTQKNVIKLKEILMQELEIKP
jgi:hypothetical protein